MTVEAYEETIESVRKKHIDYILKVNEVLGLEMSPDYTDKLNHLSYEEVTLLSEEAEKVYKSHCDNLKLDRLIKKINDIGVEAVLEKYVIERIEPELLNEVR